MLENAKLYIEEVNKKLIKIWYEPEYQYYFGSGYRFEYKFDNEYAKDFVVLNNEREIIGLINYSFDYGTKIANRFGLIHFPSKPKKTQALKKNEKKDFTDNFILGHALYQVIDDIFLKFGMEVLEFNVIVGNPIAKSYEKLVRKVGGRVLCQRTKRAQLLDGTMADDILFEITKEQYLKYKSNLKINRFKKQITEVRSELNSLSNSLNNFELGLDLPERNSVNSSELFLKPLEEGEV